jgi:hypothetical protein
MYRFLARSYNNEGSHWGDKQRFIKCRERKFMRENDRLSDHCRRFKEPISLMTKPLFIFHTQNYHIRQIVKH